MNCSRARKRFSSCFDGELSASEQVDMDLHIGSCAACAGDWDRFREGIAFLEAGLAAMPVRVPDAEGIRARALRAGDRSGRRSASLARTVIAWGLPALAIPWFAGSILHLVLGTVIPVEAALQDEMVSALSAHAAMWILLYGVLVMGTYALFFTEDLVALTRVFWVLRGRPAVALVGDPRALQCLGLSLFAFAFFASRWYGSCIFAA